MPWNGDYHIEGPEYLNYEARVTCTFADNSIGTVTNVDGGYRFVEWDGLRPSDWYVVSDLKLAVGAPPKPVWKKRARVHHVYDSDVFGTITDINDRLITVRWDSNGAKTTHKRHQLRIVDPVLHPAPPRVKVKKACEHKGGVIVKAAGALACATCFSNL